VFLAVMLVEFSPVARGIAHDKLKGHLAGFIKGPENTGSGNNAPERKAARRTSQLAFDEGR
jgi:hypothetical protein